MHSLKCILTQRRGRVIRSEVATERPEKEGCMPHGRGMGGNDKKVGRWVWREGRPACHERRRE